MHNKNTQQVQKVLGYTHTGYALMIEYAGYAWLDRYFATDAELKNVFVTSKMFWQWWVNHWDLRDAEFLKETSLRFMNEELDGDELQIALGFFVEKHCVKNLSIVPNYLVRQEVNGLLKKQREHLKNLIEKN